MPWGKGDAVDEHWRDFAAFELWYQDQLAKRKLDEIDLTITDKIELYAMLVDIFHAGIDAGRNPWGWADHPATPGTTPATPTLAERLALAVCRGACPTGGPCPVGEICSDCRRDSAAVAHELSSWLRERHAGSSQVAECGGPCWEAQDPRHCDCGALWRDVPIRLDEGRTQRGNGNGGPTTPKPPIKPQPSGGRLTINNKPQEDS
jgi:hypothetical protein